MSHWDDGDWSPDHYAMVDGLQVRYRRRPGVSGASGATRPPLVLVNGIGAAMEMWAPFVAALDGRELIAYDLPGAGESGSATHPVMMSWFADRLASLLDHLQVPQADVLGFSFGGTVAQEFAVRHPKRVNRLVLASTSPGVTGLPGSPIALLAASTPLRYLDPVLGAMLVPIMVGGRTLRDRQVLLREMPLRQERPPTWWGYLTQLGAISTWAGGFNLTRITAPTLVLHGDDDPLCPVLNARLMASLLPSSRYREVAGAGHLMLLDESAVAAEAVLEFLDEGLPTDGSRQDRSPKVTPLRPSSAA